MRTLTCVAHSAKCCSLSAREVAQAQPGFNLWDSLGNKLNCLASVYVDIMRQSSQNGNAATRISYCPLKIDEFHRVIFDLAVMGLVFYRSRGVPSRPTNTRPPSSAWKIALVVFVAVALVSFTDAEGENAPCSSSA